jgi:hypothetical protein
LGSCQFEIAETFPITLKHIGSQQTAIEGTKHNGNGVVLL